MKTLEEVMTYAREHELFDQNLRKAVKNAVRYGVPSSQWGQLMTYFAESPAELDELSDPYNIPNRLTMCRAFRTVLAYTSAACPSTLYGHNDAEATAMKSAKRRSKPVAKAKQPRKSAKKTKGSGK